MDHQAHGLDLNHAIFNEPNRPRFTWTEQPREPQYTDNTSVLYPDGMGETYRLTPFEKSKPEDAWNPTLVNHEGFFTDVPGFENLAEGHSAKVLGSLSLARQGRYFYWGFSIDPQRSTAAAQDTLVNVLHYMHRMRHSLTVEYVCRTRQSLQVYLDLYERKDYLRGIEEHLPGSLTPDARQTYTPTPEGCAEWLAKYGPYLFSGKGPRHRGERYDTIWEIDDDAMALGTPNAERASLERWIALATAADTEPRNRARALRCLRRYVHPDIAPAEDADWNDWYAQWSDRIVFIQSTGFWWQEDPRVLEREAARRR